MESTPRPIPGYPRALPQRIPFSLAALATGLRGFSRPREPVLTLARPSVEEAVLAVRGALSTAGALDLKRLVSEALVDGASQVTIDLREATRIGPAALAAMVEVTQRAGAVGVQVVGLSPEARLLLEKASLHVVIEILE